ncbi:MAG: hypothetical protein ABIK95_01025 [Acidobacteriota bacterium]
MSDRRRYSDRREYLIEAVKKRRKKVRQMAIDFKGGKCQVCGYNKCPEALEFHHLEESEKDFGISDKGYTRSWSRIKEELSKCILLCANCHREIHSMLQLPREIVVEKSGELKEAFIPYLTGNGNPEPSPDTVKSIREGAETRAEARTPDCVRGKRPTPSLRYYGAGDEIVQSWEKFRGSCNH